MLHSTFPSLPGSVCFPREVRVGCDCPSTCVRCVWLPSVRLCVCVHSVVCVRRARPSRSKPQGLGVRGHRCPLFNLCDARPLRGAAARCSEPGARCTDLPGRLRASRGRLLIRVARLVQTLAVAGCSQGRHMGREIRPNLATLLLIPSNRGARRAQWQRTFHHCCV